MDETGLQVICLCAGWCGVCRDYRAVFDEARATFGAAADFRWIDIEDEAALLDDIDVEDFPTVLIARGDRPLFFGPITPQPGTLARLVQGGLTGDLGVAARAGAVAEGPAGLLRRLRPG